MLITLVAGARPNFMKIAPIIKAIDEAILKGENISYRLVHTGQHFDHKMSGSFFDQLGIPEPHTNLDAGGGTQAEQTAAIMVRFEKELIQNPSDLVLVVGDVTSTMACAITAQKLCIKVAHVEGGIRSGDWTMPEEINRLVTDSITNYFFTTSEQANENLRKAGTSENSIFFVGNTMIDTLLGQMSKFIAPAFWNDYNLETGKYWVVTLHRPSNVDDAKQLKALMDAIAANNNGLPVIFPVHPRTRKNLETIEYPTDNIYLVEPLSYLEFNYLVKNAVAVITDSGGITEETTVMQIPCITLRNSTERPETVTVGTNELIGNNPANLGVYMNKVIVGDWKKGGIPKLWDGKTAGRIVDVLINRLN